MLGLALLTGCGAAIEQSQVESRFRSMFACASPHVVAEGGGYRAEGCGVTAHFRCFEGPRAYDQRKGDSLLGAALATDTCVLEHSERAARPRAERTVERANSDDGVVRLRARGMIRG